MSARATILLMWMRGLRRRWRELAVVVFSAGAQGVEAQQELGVAGFAALVEQLFDVVGIFEVAVPLVTAGMSGDEIVRRDRGRAGRRRA